MMITENNYEEYFLLYADNELNAAERNMVTAFVEQHPEYAAALKALLQTKLSDDENFVFNNKEALYRNADAEIGIDNYETYFLLYTDNELSEAAQESTERFVLQHPQLQAEFTLLQQAKLSPETISYPNRKELYKKERRVIVLSLNRMAAAAAVLIAVAFGWLLPFKQSSHTRVDVIAKSAEIKKPVIQTVTPVLQPATTPALSQRTKENRKAQNKQTEYKQPVLQSVEFAKTESKAEVKKNELVVLPDVSQTQTQPQLQTVLTHVEPEPGIIKQTTDLRPLEEVNDDENAQTALSLSNDNAAAKPAIYKELNTDEEARTLYVGSLQLNKAKVNGFLKSASHLFGSKVKQNAD